MECTERAIIKMNGVMLGQQLEFFLMSAIDVLISRSGSDSKIVLTIKKCVPKKASLPLTVFILSHLFFGKVDVSAVDEECLLLLLSLCCGLGF